MNSKKVSVIIPSFNRYSYLLNAISSIQNQTYDNYEIIVVNDGSTEDGYNSTELKNISKVIHIDRNNTPNWCRDGFLENQLHDQVNYSSWPIQYLR